MWVCVRACVWVCMFVCACARGVCVCVCMHVWVRMCVAYLEVWQQVCTFFAGRIDDAT